MLINITTQKTISKSDFRRIYANSSFPEAMQDSDIFPFGYANVYYMEQPAVAGGFCVAQDGFAEIDGLWQAKWVIVPKSADLLEQERINAVHMNIEAEEARITQRALRESLATGDMSMINEVEANIASLRTQLVPL